MPPPRPSLDPVDPVKRFALALRDLHRAAGRPKQRVLATALHCSDATVSAILNGHRFPAWEQAEALVLACGGEVRDWKRLWMDADREINAEAGAETPIRLQTAQANLRPLSGRNFYAAMLAEVNKANYRIMTTFIRHRPPDYFLSFTDEDTSRAASAYFDGVLTWSDRPGPRSARRIICTPNAEMKNWAEQFARDTANFPRHEIRVVDWNLTVDAINMAIFDHTVAFLAFTVGAAQQLHGFRVDEPHFVRSSIGYFEQMWSGASRLLDHS